MGARFVNSLARISGKSYANAAVATDHVLD
jgi:hypothetical protein